MSGAPAPGDTDGLAARWGLTARLTSVLLRRDLVILARSRDTLGLVLMFAALCVLLFAFGFLREGAAAAEIAPGALWVTLLFSTTLATLRLFAADEEAGALQLCLHTAAGTSPLFFAKALMQGLFGALITALLLPLVWLFFSAPAVALPQVLLALGLGLVGQALLGTLVAALMVHVRLRELLLPLLLYPLTTPLLIAGVKVTAIALGGGDLSLTTPWLGLMVVFDAVLLLLSPWLFARAT